MRAAGRAAAGACAQQRLHLHAGARRYGRDAVDEFWFDRKLGFCEHFAGAFVVLMRAMDVPARIVTGYQGTDPEPVDGYHIVRQSHAHAWAEYWQPGDGWVRADPTAAVAPERIQVSRNLQPPRGLVANALDTVNPALALQLRQAWEAMNNRWNQWVLNYSRGQQFDLLRRTGLQRPGLGRPELPADRPAVCRQPGRCRLGAVGPSPAGPLATPAAARGPGPAALGVTVAAHDPPRQRAERVRHTLGERGDELAGSWTHWTARVMPAASHARSCGAGGATLNAPRRAPARPDAV
jgi:hypothetical protein